MKYVMVLFFYFLSFESSFASDLTKKKSKPLSSNPFDNLVDNQKSSSNSEENSFFKTPSFETIQSILIESLQAEKNEEIKSLREELMKKFKNLITQTDKSRQHFETMLTRMKKQNEAFNRLIEKIDKIVKNRRITTNPFDIINEKVESGASKEFLAEDKSLAKLHTYVFKKGKSGVRFNKRIFILTPQRFSFYKSLDDGKKMTRLPIEGTLVKKVESKGQHPHCLGLYRNDSKPIIFCFSNSHDLNFFEIGFLENKNVSLEWVPGSGKDQSLHEELEVKNTFLRIFKDSIDEQVRLVDEEHTLLMTQRNLLIQKMQSYYETSK